MKFPRRDVFTDFDQLAVQNSFLAIYILIWILFSNSPCKFAYRNAFLVVVKDLINFFYLYPEIETEAKIYAANTCKQRSASFSVHDLAKFIDNKFYELTDETKTHKKRNAFLYANLHGELENKIHIRI